ncbi:MAG: helix-turn-helix domain-containing protein, partial [Candidatus Doudnabacteria bacterium]|nr:helix-turn-helix domain-containing protein [Candidatus Doudnabacteria bacterium]
MQPSSQELFLEGKKYIPSKLVATLFHFNQDYVGQLCREGRVVSRKVGKAWYVEENSIHAYIAELEAKNEKASEIIEPKKEPVLSIYAHSETSQEPEYSKVFQTAQSTSAIRFSKVDSFNNPVALREKQHAVAVKHFSPGALAASALLVVVVFGSLVMLGSTKKQNTNNVLGTAEGISATVSEAFQATNNELQIISEKVISLIASLDNYVMYAFGGSSSPPPDDPPPRANDPALAASGMVVVPSSGNEAKEIQKIKDSFSDEVKVVLDESGTSGIITPIFRNPELNSESYDKYLYA